MEAVNKISKAAWVQLISILHAFLLSTVFMPFTKGGINYLLIGTSGASVVFLFMVYPNQLAAYYHKLIIGFIAVFTFSFLYNLAGASMSSFFYSWYFFISFIVLAGTAAEYFNEELFSKILYAVLGSFLVVMLVQQAAGILGMPVFNINPGFETNYVESLYFFRYNSLTNEPSYGATMVVVMFYLHYQLHGFHLGKFYWWYLGVLYLIVSFQSATGTALYACILFYMMQRRSKLWWLLLVPALAGLATYFSQSRIGTLIAGFDWRNAEESLIGLDLSAAFRFVPNLLYLKNVSLGDLHFWFGHGYGYAGNLVASFMPGIEIEDKFAGGILPVMLYDYGFVPVLVLWVWVIRCLSVGNKWVFGILWLTVCLNANLNTQFVWWFLTFAYWARHAQQNNAESNKLIFHP